MTSNKERKNNIIPFIIINFVLGIFKPFVSLLVSTDIITSGKQGENVFIFSIIGILLIVDYIYTYINWFVKFLFEKDTKNISENINRIAVVLYFIASTIMLFIICNMKNLGETGIILLVVEMIVSAITLFITVRHNNNLHLVWFNNGMDHYNYTFVYLLDYFKKENRNNKDNIKEVKKHYYKRAIFGAICGIIATLIITGINYFIIFINETIDNQIKIFICIIATLVLQYILIVIFNIFNEKRTEKFNSNKLKYYGVLQLVGNNTFVLVETILLFVSLQIVFKLNIYLSFLVVFVLRFIYREKYNTNYAPIQNSFSSNTSNHTSNKEIESKSKKKFKTTYLNNGTKAFSYEVADGITKTTYTDKDGNKTDVTSYDITDDIQYKTIEKK